MLHAPGVVVHDHNHNRGIWLSFASTWCHSPSRPQSGRPACRSRSPAESGKAVARRRHRSAVQPSGSFAPHRSFLERRLVLLPCMSHRSPILQQHRAPARQLNPLSHKYQTWRASAALLGASGWRASAPSPEPATRGVTRSGPTNRAHRDPTCSGKYGIIVAPIEPCKSINFINSIHRSEELHVLPNFHRS